MGCCGGQRASMRRDPVLSGSGNVQPWSPAATEFEYSGGGEISVTGPMTGVIYRFASGGPPVLVHAADAPSMVYIAGLRAVH